MDAVQHIRGLNADHQVLIPHFFNNPYFVQRTFYQRLRRYTAIFLQQRLLQGTAVDTHPDRNIFLLALVYHCAYPVFTSYITRINPDFVGTVLHCRDSKFVIKMNIRYQWDRDLLFDLGNSLGRLHRRHSHPDNITSRLGQLLNLLHGIFHMLGLCICHGLNGDGMTGSDLYAADGYFTCLISHFILHFLFRNKLNHQ